MKLNRRQFLKAGVAGGALALSPRLAAQANEALYIPPLLDVRRGKPLSMTFHPIQLGLNGAPRTPLIGIDGQYIGPTVLSRAGMGVALVCRNLTAEPIALAVQGIQSAGRLLSATQAVVEPNQTIAPMLMLDQPACSAWYHANTPQRSASQTYHGLYGLWLVEDAQSKESELPKRYGIDDIPVILQDQLMDDENRLVFDPNEPLWGAQARVNGQLLPRLTVEKGLIRLRLLNASLSRSYEIAFDNGQSFWHIATGVSFLPKPVTRDSLWLAPGERAEIVVDLNAVQEVALITGRVRTWWDRLELFFDQHNALADNRLLVIKTQGLPAAFNQLAPLPAVPVLNLPQPVQTRQFELRPEDGLINEQRFDAKRIDVEAQLGSCERWLIRSSQAVGFRIQGAKFVLERRGEQVQKPATSVWRDIIWLAEDQEVSLLVWFAHPVPREAPRTFGVSDLILADKGASAQYCVLGEERPPEKEQAEAR